MYKRQVQNISDEVFLTRDANMVNSLAGKIAGVTINASAAGVGGETKVVMRGSKSIEQSSNALYVIDGIPMCNFRSDGSEEFDSQGSSEAIADLNPEDIESMTVLSGAAAAALYGSDAANGAILITTKRGQNEHPVIRYDGQFSVSGVSKTYDMLNAYEFAQLYKESRDNAYLTEVPSGSIDDPYNERGATGYYKVPPIITAYLEDKSGTLTDTDWQDAIFRTALAHKHSLSVSGRTKTLSYYVGANYLYREGTIIGSDFERYGMRANIDGKRKRLKYGASFSPSYSKYNFVDADAQYGNDGVIASALMAAPIFPVYNADGSYSDASGCGNETASERAMVRHYIVESVKFWAKEYHIDGFRFDLMGIHDIETMNRIREELSKIAPTIFIYGEGWLAADSPLPPEKRAVRDHVGQMEGIAVFCDDFRDAVRGSTFDEHACGYASGNIGGHYEPVKFGIVGATQHTQVDYNGLLYSSVPYAAAPSQAVNFVASHDGYTVIDKLRLSVTGDRAEEELLPIDKLIHTILLTAQGVPFIRAGEEMMQDKQGEPNSFRSPDAVNQIDWALKAEHRGLFDYVRQLIALRKAHPAFRIPTAEGLRQWLRFLDTGDSGVIAYTLGEHANGDAWKEILVAYNGNRHPAEFRIPEAERIVVCRDGRIDPDSRERLSGEVVRMAPSSALIAYCE